MATDWTKVNSKWYYMSPDGARQTGWIELEDKWYYLDMDGVMQTGFIQRGLWWCRRFRMYNRPKYQDENGYSIKNKTRG